MSARHRSGSLRSMFPSRHIQNYDRFDEKGAPSLIPISSCPDKGSLMKTKRFCLALAAITGGLFIPFLTGASTEAEASQMLDLTGTWFGIAAVIVFVIAYATVISEELLHLRKSKPVMVAAGHPKFITLAYINIVVAANAGGASAPSVTSPR